MNKRRLKKEVKIGIIIIVIITVILIGIKIISVRSTNEFMLSKLGYSKEEISNILKLKNTEVLTLVKGYSYQKHLNSLIKDKYFMFKNLDRYLAYFYKNSNLIARNVVEVVNTNRDRNYYTEINSADITKGPSILVNKYYGLNKEFKPNDLKDVSLKYSYTGNKLVSEVIDSIEELIDDGKRSNYNFIVNYSYIDYKSQEDRYKKEELAIGKEETDKKVIRAGHSEHQLGLAVDINLYKTKYDKLENTEEYKWLVENAHKYGFILRYPKEKENITGYLFEPWHYRYVGKKIAKYIYENKITFDEYYAYYIEK